MLNYRSADTLFRRASGTVACVSVLALTAIVLFLLAQGLPIFKDVIRSYSSRVSFRLPMSKFISLAYSPEASFRLSGFLPVRCSVILSLE